MTAFCRKYKKTLTTDEIAFLTKFDTKESNFYGLPKIQTQNCLFRPILSMIGSPQHHLAKCLITELQPVLDKFSNRIIKDSFSFVNVHYA